LMKTSAHRADVRCGAILFIFLAATYLFFMNPAFTGYDVESYLVARNVFANGSVALSEEPVLGKAYEGGVPGEGAKRYARSGWLDTAAVLPFYAAGRVADGIFGVESGLLSLFSTLAVAPLAAAFCGLLVYILSLRWSDRKAALFTAIAYSLGTMALAYSNIRIETLLAACLLLAFHGLLKYRESASLRRAMLAGAACGAAVGVKAYGLLLILPFAAGFLASGGLRKKGHPAAFAMPVAAGAVLQGAYNAVRFSGWADTGYAATFGFDAAHLGQCLYVLFLSPAKSIFIFCPTLFLSLFSLRGFYRDNRFESTVILSFTILLVLFISTFREPLLFADEIWGSRYLFPAVAFMAPAAGTWWSAGGIRKNATLALAGLGFLANLPGVLIRPEAVFVYSNRLCEVPEQCRLVDAASNGIYVHAKLLLGAGPEFMEAWSHPWTWWAAVIDPATAAIDRAGAVEKSVTPLIQALGICGAAACIAAAGASLCFLAKRCLSS